MLGIGQEDLKRRFEYHKDSLQGPIKETESALDALKYVHSVKEAIEVYLDIRREYPKYVKTVATALDDEGEVSDYRCELIQFDSGIDFKIEVGWESRATFNFKIENRFLSLFSCMELVNILSVDRREKDFIYLLDTSYGKVGLVFFEKSTQDGVFAIKHFFRVLGVRDLK